MCETQGSQAEGMSEQLTWTVSAHAAHALTSCICMALDSTMRASFLFSAKVLRAASAVCLSLLSLYCIACNNCATQEETSAYADISTS